MGGAMDWIDLAQDRDRWRAFVNPVLNLTVSTDKRLVLVNKVNEPTIFTKCKVFLD
jgi:hypothetical protein